MKFFSDSLMGGINTFFASEHNSGGSVSSERLTRHEITEGAPVYEARALTVDQAADRVAEDQQRFVSVGGNVYPYVQPAALGSLATQVENAPQSAMDTYHSAVSRQPVAERSDDDLLDEPGLSYAKDDGSRPTEDQLAHQTAADHPSLRERMSEFLTKHETEPEPTLAEQDPALYDNEISIAGVQPSELDALAYNTGVLDNGTVEQAPVDPSAVPPAHSVSDFEAAALQRVYDVYDERDNAGMRAAV